MKIITELQVKVTSGEQARALGKGTDKIEAYLRLIKARKHLLCLNKEDNLEARRILEEVISLDPDYAIAYTLLGTTHFLDITFGATASPKQSVANAVKSAQKAISLDDSLADAHRLLGLIYTMTKQYEKGIAASERAVTLGPNDEGAHRTLGMALRYAGRWEESIPEYKKAIRLNPFPTSRTFCGLCMAYIFCGRHEEAVSACKKAILRQPNDIFSHIALTFAYCESGHEEDARAAAAQVLRINPKFSVDHFAKKALTYKNPADTKRFVAALRNAGLK